jgi:hypothetical protein
MVGDPRRGSWFIEGLSMERTLKGKAGVQLSPSVYEILKRPDGAFDIYRDGKLADASIPDRWLEEQLVKYGICGQEYRDSRRKLEELGEARLVFQSGRIKTKLRTGDDSQL